MNLSEIIAPFITSSVAYPVIGIFGLYFTFVRKAAVKVAAPKSEDSETALVARLVATLKNDNYNANLLD